MLTLAQRLRSELLNELDRLTAANQDLRMRLGKVAGRSQPDAEMRLVRLDPLGHLHVRAIQSLRTRLDKLDEQLKEPEGRDLQDLCQALADLTRQASGLAAEIADREAVARDQEWLSPARRPTRLTSRTA